MPENETEVSFFNRDLYENFRLNPQVLLLFSRYLNSLIYLVDSVGMLNFIRCVETLFGTSSGTSVYYSGSKEESKKWIYMRVLHLVTFDDGVG